MKRWVCLGVLLAMIVHPGLAQEKTAGQGGEARSAQKVFTFGGGNLRDFVATVKQQFGFDLQQAASIDRDAFSLTVPKMKIPGVTRWVGVLLGYNQLSAETDMYERLGRWVISPSPERVDTGPAEAIIFLPPKNFTGGAGVKVKAFSLDKLKKQDLDAVQETIDVQVHIMRASGSPESFEGQVRYHEGTGLLIASGAHDYVELATTIIEAFEVTLSRRRPEGFPE